MLVIIFHRLGPYHHARLNAVGTEQQVTALELCAKDNTYAWEVLTGAGAFNRVTLLDSGDVEDRPPRVVSRLVRAALDDLKPEAVAVPGWSSIGALAALQWCSLRQVPAIMMSDSTRENRPRSMWKEAVKRRVLNLASAALVAGTRHAEYLTDLGMSRDRVFLGYDVVDNDYFARKAEEVRSQWSVVRSQNGLPERYFLASARFILEKNLPRLIQAYARYRKMVDNGLQDNKTTGPSVVSSPVVPWDLVLLGDGPLRETLNSQLSTLNLHDHVLMPGFKQYADLPSYYALAEALILPSISETWGLVVNEAMASGLPVLVSNRCGCAPDLVQEEKNGFTFDPYDVEQLAQLMLLLSETTDHGPRTMQSKTGVRGDRSEASLEEMGKASREIISAWGPERFAKGLHDAVETALKNPRPRPGLLDRLLLKALIYK